MKFTIDGLLNGIRREIHDELKIEQENLAGFTEDNIIHYDQV